MAVCCDSCLENKSVYYIVQHCRQQGRGGQGRGGQGRAGQGRGGEGEGRAGQGGEGTVHTFHKPEHL